MPGSEHYDYVVVGAGAAGLQMAYFLQKSGRSYVVYETGKEAAGFFENHPRNGRLISINKKNNFFDEEDFNLRHDWNSLLSDDPTMKFTKYSDDLFPESKDLRRYMNDFANKFQLNIQYNTKVVKIGKKNQQFFVTAKKVKSTVEDDSTITARCVLMATGAVEENLPETIDGLELIDTYSNYILDKKLYEDKMVLVIGGGNSAFEAAEYLSDTAGIVHVAFRKRINFAWNTHYVGDLRAVNTNILDMYNLKSLHAAIAYEVVKVSKNEDGKFVVSFKNLGTHLEVPGWIYGEIEYDHVISCLGWKYTSPDIFDDSINIEFVKEGRYPKLSNCWETNTENLFYIGTTMASIDRQSASGFIHGFRYNIRTLNNLLENRFFGKELPYEILPCRDLQAVFDKFIGRMTHASSLYQMNGLLSDALLMENDGTMKYYLDLPWKHILEKPEFKSAKDLFVVALIYGSHRFGTSAKGINDGHGPDITNGHCSAFLHPVIVHYRYGEYVDQLEILESLLIRYDEWSTSNYPQWPNVVNESYVKHYFNDKMHWTDEKFNLNALTEAIMERVIPLTEEEISRLAPRLEDSVCRPSRELLPKEKVTKRQRNLKPTKEEILASIQEQSSSN